MKTVLLFLSLFFVFSGCTKNNSKTETKSDSPSLSDKVFNSFKETCFVNMDHSVILSKNAGGGRAGDNRAMIEKKFDEGCSCLAKVEVSACGSKCDTEDGYREYLSKKGYGDSKELKAQKETECGKHFQQ